MAQQSILRLNQAGQPVAWLHWQEAATLFARDNISWSLGETVYRLRGGINRATASRSVIELPSIIACKGEHAYRPRLNPLLTNRTLFERDNYHCMYCGIRFDYKSLTRDHIKPRSKGGRDAWENVVAACRRCNQRKGNSYIHDGSMELLALPYRPNLAEYLALLNGRRILPDQEDFLSKFYSKNWRVVGKAS